MAESGGDVGRSACSSRAEVPHRRRDGNGSSGSREIRVVVRSLQPRSGDNEIARLPRDDRCANDVEPQSVAGKPIRSVLRADTGILARNRSLRLTNRRPRDRYRGEGAAGYRRRSPELRLDVRRVDLLLFERVRISEVVCAGVGCSFVIRGEGDKDVVARSDRKRGDGDRERRTVSLRLRGAESLNERDRHYRPPARAGTMNGQPADACTNVGAAI